MNNSVIATTRSLQTRSVGQLDVTYQQYTYSGFLSIQNLIDEAVYSLTAVDMTANMRSVADGVAPMSLLSTQSFAYIATPFPTTGFYSNQFYLLAGPLFGLVLVLSTLYPFSRCSLIIIIKNINSLLGNLFHSFIAAL